MTQHGFDTPGIPRRQVRDRPGFRVRTSPQRCAARAAATPWGSRSDARHMGRLARLLGRRVLALTPSAQKDPNVSARSHRRPLAALAGFLACLALPAGASAGSPGTRNASREAGVRPPATRRVQITVRVGDLCSQTTALMRATRTRLSYP